jgi:hypothetical protein
MTIDQRLRAAAEDAREVARHVDIPMWRAPRRQWATALAATVIVLLLGAAAWWLAGSSADGPVFDSVPSPEVVPTGSPAVRAVPDETGIWSEETSLGTWTWSRVERSVPLFGMPIPSLGDRRYHLVDQTGIWWVSEDGLGWSRESVPEKYVSAPFLGIPWAALPAGDEEWVRTQDATGTEIYFRRVEGSWVQVDLGDPAPTTSFAEGPAIEVTSRGGITVALLGDTEVRIDDGSGFRSIEVPWPDRDPRDLSGWWSSDLGWVAGRFVVLIGDDVDPVAWLSADGLEWDSIGSLGFTSSAYDMWGDETRLFVNVEDGYGRNEPFPVWTSDDGRDWQPVEFGSMTHDIGVSGDWGSGFRAGAVWVMSVIRANPWRAFHQIWMSGDGSVWEPVPLAVQFGRSDRGVFIVDHTVFHRDSRFLTVGRLED